MDTKLKKSKTLGMLLWIAAISTGTLCGTVSSLGLALDGMLDVQKYSPYFTNSRYYVRDLEILQGREILSWICIIGAILALLFFTALIILCVFSGNYSDSRDENGVVTMNWFDKIWSEVQFILLGGAITGAVALAYPMTFQWPALNWFSFYTPYRTQGDTYGIHENVLLFLCLLGMLLGVALSTALFVSMIKKIKNHKFWKESLCGRVFMHLFGIFNSSDKTLLKCSVAFAVAMLLAMTWFGVILDIIAFVYFAPKLIEKLQGIEKGVNEVKGGNLSYKIETTDPSSKFYDELDRIGEGINEIADASKLAIQNELKQQRLKTDLISNVSHDLKTPLTSMISYVDLLKKEGLDSENAPEYLRIIDEKTNRLKLLTENLFEAAKASSGAIPVNKGTIDLIALVNQSIGEMDEKLKARNLDIIVSNHTDSAAVNVDADGQLLWRVIENLLSNTAKYALSGSRVYIDVNENSNMVELVVKNISENPLNLTADELMERFVRGDESRSTEGSGLGLAIAKDLTHLMDGRFNLVIDGDLFKAEVTLHSADRE